jgi:8-oxo-dGTP pyrophosphatase MutT (NUDIX family)
MTLLSSISKAVKNSIYMERCNLVLASANPFSRSFAYGHITASGLVIHDEKALLIFHPYIKRWFQPGGHIDEGELPVDAAIREVYEETGLVCILDPQYPEVIDVDIHEIPANPEKGEAAHLHIDLLYRLKVLRQEKSPEEIASEWFSFDQIENARIQRALGKLSP